MNRPLSPLTIERALAQYPVGYGGLVSVHVRGHAPRLAPDLVVPVSMVCPRTVGDARQNRNKLFGVESPCPVGHPQPVNDNDS